MCCKQLSPSQIDSVARGRIFSGADAKELGLVDLLGGLSDAFALARKLADPKLRLPIPRVRLERSNPLFSSDNDVLVQALVPLMINGISSSHLSFAERNHQLDLGFPSERLAQGVYSLMPSWAKTAMRTSRELNRVSAAITMMNSDAPMMLLDPFDLH